MAAACPTTSLDILPKQFDYVDRLDKTSLSSIKWYSTKEYKSFNDALRTSKSLSSDQYEHYISLCNSINSSPPLDTPLTVYRGVTRIEYIIPNPQSIVSTSHELDTALTFSSKLSSMHENNCCVLQISIPAGCSVLPIEKHSDVPDEHEVLLPPNGTYILVSSEPAIQHETFVYFVTYNPASALKISGSTLKDVVE